MEDSILQQEEELGEASVELCQLRADLREALSLFNSTQNPSNGIVSSTSSFVVVLCLFRSERNHN